MGSRRIRAERVLGCLLGTTIVVLTSGCAPAEGTIPASARSAAAQAVIPRSALLADFDLMVEALEAAHPRLLHYTSPEVVSAALGTARARIDRDLTGAEFFRISAEAVAAIADGHTRIQLPGSDETAVAPFEAHVLDGRAWIKAAYHEAVPAPGAEILSINGMPLGEILNLMAGRISVDFGLASGKRARMSNRFAERYAELVEAPPAYSLVVSQGSGQETVPIPAIPRSKYRSLRAEKKAEPPIAWRMLDGTTAYVHLASFSDGNFEHVGREFRASLDSAMNFVRQSGAEALVFDIRQNGGGEASNGAYAAAYFLDRSFTYLTSVTASSSELPVIEHTQWADDPAGNQDEYRSILAPRAEGRFDVTAPWYPMGTIQPQAWTFSGSLYVITDGRVSSTGSDFAAIIHSHDRATFVGEMMGGSYDGNASGLTARVTLPATGAVLQVPLFDFRLASGSPPHPSGAFEPDLRVRAGIEDILAGSDPELAAAASLARGEATEEGSQASP